MKKIFVCAGTGLAQTARINEEASLLGKLLAVNKYAYVQSGYAFGLMGLTLREFVKYSKNVEFVILDMFYDKDAPVLIELVGENNFIATKTHSEADRLRHIKTCDEIIVLPGGTGTLEELLYSNEAARTSELKSNITVVNIEGFYNGFIEQLERNQFEGLSNARDELKFKVVDTVIDIPALKNFMD